MKQYLLFVTFVLCLITLHSFKLNTVSTTTDQTRYTIKVGQSFSILLDENPSTGYTNYLLNADKLKSVKLVKTNFKMKGHKNCAGCGGKTTYTFKGIKKGTDTLNMVNGRKWESTFTPVLTTIVTVK